ncbi:MAG TPA: M28 family peptidase [Solirubrobacteraceae bacterium]|nr:M28 family peptidase [Solirubrobacteraceae bacterium]
MKRSLALATAGALLFAAPAWADREHSTNNTSKKLRQAVTVEGIMEHQQAFQDIATITGGNRLSGTPGFDASADYVADKAAAAGLEVSRFDFEYEVDVLADYEAPVLDVVSGGPERSFIAGMGGTQLGSEFGSMLFSPPGDVTAPVWAADLDFDPATAATNTSGCTASDYDGMPDGAIVILQWDTNCGLGTKFFTAQDQGASAIVFFDVEGPFWINVTGTSIPSVEATAAAAEALAGGVEQGDTGVTARLKVDFRPGTYPTQNVIAETTDGDPDSVIVVGAHLDSVGVGPGINDNGSGSSAILEIAEQIRKVKPRSTIRFMWFGAEEHGLLGSQAYVDSLSDEERGRIKAMLNFDMIGSPNFVRFVYDGDLSDSEPPEGGAPAASAEIEQLFLDYFAGEGLETEPTAFDGRSDYGPFIFAGIPAGGLFTGAEGIKTEEQAEIYGGVAGEQYDPCYHFSCDDIDNLSLTALDQMSDAAAHATITLAQTKDLFASTPSAPITTGGGAGSSGGHDHGVLEAPHTLGEAEGL